MKSCWEEALDVDDSDLTLLRPCKRHRRHETNLNNNHTSSPSQTLDFSISPPQQFDFPLQPTPTPTPTPTPSSHLIPGPAGVVQAAMLRKDHHHRNSPLSTQDYIRRAVNDSDEDADFKSNPWLSAIEFVSGYGMVDSVGPNAPLGGIKTYLKNGKLDQVVAIIKSSTPNGLGDLMVTLKDPMGTISGTIHHKVLTEGKFGKDISVGSVLILHKVSVFSPSRSAHYLNITIKNLIKVFHKDTPTLRNNSNGGVDTAMLNNAFSHERGAENITNGKHFHQGRVGLFSSSDKNPEIEVNKEMFKETEIDENEQVKRRDAAAIEKQIEPKMTNDSLPHWTDEQLNQLLACDFEDDF